MGASWRLATTVCVVKISTLTLPAPPSPLSSIIFSSQFLITNPGSLKSKAGVFIPAPSTRWP